MYSPAMTDFIFMSEQTSYMFVTGPEVVKTVTHEDVNTEYLGGANTHTTKSGVADFSFDNEITVLQQLRRLFDFLPQSNISEQKVKKFNDSINRKIPSLNTLVPQDKNKAYDIKELILNVADEKDFLEVQKDFAKNIVIGFIRLEGRSIGIVANQPLALAGCLDINSSGKRQDLLGFVIVSIYLY